MATLTMRVTSALDEPVTFVRMASAVSVTAPGATWPRSVSNRSRTASLSPTMPTTAMMAKPAGKTASTPKKVSDPAASRHSSRMNSLIVRRRR